MTEENLKKAIFLDEKIRLISEELSEWSDSVEMRNFQLMNRVGVTTNFRHSNVDFELLKEFVIKELSKKLEEAKSEFKKL